MSLRSQPLKPTPEIQRSTDTPAARVDWHLACMKAKSMGLPLPPPPWETPLNLPNKKAASPADPLSALSIPRRPKTTPPARETAETKRRKPHGSSRRKDKETAPREGRPTAATSSTKVTKTEPPLSSALESGALPVLPTREVLAFPARPITIALAAEKREVVATLLLRAGVPKKILMAENRSQTVIDHAISYVQEPAARTLHKYNLGRQFVIHGGVGHINKTAEVVLPLLLAATAPEVENLSREAERWIQTKVLPLNMPGPKVTAPTR